MATLAIGGCLILCFYAVHDAGGIATIKERLPDALRFTLSTFPPSNKRIALAPKRIEGYRHFANKVWNASRLVLATHPDSPTSPDLVKRYVRYGSSPRGAQGLILSTYWTSIGLIAASALDAG